MGKKKDLLNLLSKKSESSMKRRNSSRNPNNRYNNFNQNAEDNNVRGNNLQRNAGFGLRNIGLPKLFPSFTATNNRTNELVDIGEAFIKLPKPLKIIRIAAIIIVTFLMLSIYVTLFGVEASASEYGTFAYGQTCPTITVVDTGCNPNGASCSRIYDGEVEFENYIAGVVAAEVGIVNNLEYYKVAAIAARTYVLKHVGSSCEVKGNTHFQAYKDVDASNDRELIKQAVEETKGLVLVKGEELASTFYASACVVNADDHYYYVRYGRKSLGEANFQKIPIAWDTNESAFRGYLGEWYSKVDKNNNNYLEKRCPSNHDYGMSQIGALYLITNENYNHEQVIKYYYGDDVQIMSNEMKLPETEDGFINPTRYIHCTSPFGYRIHPVKKTKKFHGGLDIAITGGEPVYAAKSGTVKTSLKTVRSINDCNYSYGNYILIDHGDGTATLYAHLKYGSIPNTVYEGAMVTQGDQIGQVGSTGCSTGNHLHYEVRLNNEKVDPADYIDLTGATGTCKR